MLPNPYLDAIYQHNAVYKHANPDMLIPLREFRGRVNTPPAPLHTIEKEFRRMQATIRMSAGYFNA
jgi:hypothetical protein